MSVQVSTPPSTLPPSSPPTARRRQLWLQTLRVLWVVAAVITVQMLLLGLRPAYDQLVTPCDGPDCADYRLRPVGLDALEALGWTPHGYAVYNLTLVVITTLIALGVSVLIFRARPRDPMALYTAITLLLIASFLGEYNDVLVLIHPAFEIVSVVGYLVTLMMFVSLFYIFPDGRFVPRWSRWAFTAWIVFPIVFIVLAVMGQLDPVLPYGAAITGGLLITCLVAPIIRYRRADPTQRLQLKWALFGLVQLAAVVVVFVEVGTLVFPALDVAGTLPDAIDALVETLSLSLMFLSIAFAVMRYRLWDINPILNRTLVYVPLTSILAVVYTLAMRVSEKLFVSAAGEQPQAVAVFTTIVLTTTFSPIRNMLQGVVDRTFKEPPDPLKPLRQLEQDVNEIVSVLHHPQVLKRLVEHAVAATKAGSGALYLRDGDAAESLAYASAQFDPQAEHEAACILLTPEEEAPPLGRLLLGRCPDGAHPDAATCDAIKASAVAIIQGLHLVAAPARGPG